jgi:hypothetical protein
MRNFFFKTNFFKDKGNLKMLYSNINSHVFKINFANKTYFNNLIKLVACTQLMNKSQYKFLALTNSENGIDDLLESDSLVVSGKNSKFTHRNEC